MLHTEPEQERPMEDFETANQLEPVEGPKNIPKELAFEEVIKNRTCPVSCTRYPEVGVVVLTAFLAMFAQRFYGLSSL
jgi:hypothetical protein